MEYLTYVNGKQLNERWSTANAAKRYALQMFRDGATVEIVAQNANGCNCRSWIIDAEENLQDYTDKSTHV